jgi:L-threonylcarbamoyladenylate synthase
MKAQIGKDIELASLLLKEGKLVAIPTETVYGLGANALNQEAVAQIFIAKNRPTFDPLIVHVSSIDSIKELVTCIPQKAYDLLERFSPGPLTVLLPKSEKICDLVTAASPYVGLRIPSHPMTLELLKNLDFPIAAPSANPFGYISPTEAKHVYDQLGDKISYILDGDRSQIGVESTIVGFEEDIPTIYRFGGISQESIESVVGKVHAMTTSTSNPKTPGLLKSHYAPKKPVILGQLEKLIKRYNKDEIAVLSLSSEFEGVKHQFVLSKKGCLIEAAHNLFAALRQLDTLDIKFILAELVPDVGLGKAINDRLIRASAEP